eukprot:CAMPEP_0168347656 /NCGR_PEP_ID=MMETSP0213-20121227/19162_1 /TAXON_ID=151035 /ORGANISM="Euplotes harpa, Strain FSP1.4" /LENGTH=69 /DNA_ID=CAMNT_0008356871 /DNA_START=1481 /DNA_END=1686 /DNA_ORIENTATION=+
MQLCPNKVLPEPIDLSSVATNPNLVEFSGYAKSGCFVTVKNVCEDREAFKKIYFSESKEDVEAMLKEFP